ncbi:hypothetical protein A8C32_15720 [Flavivirga aquatica]|uniref:Glycine dehydrogenase n=1 Tax=Flavivirga aquatica TaxID=1849968 RepID=A0A1E5T967_9FLAO|nr:hypothetical protein [Flavivirga aquatica]OEK07923.1 hypothetical protein A8C32_15720 [Flavivirga aquatica]
MSNKQQKLKIFIPCEEANHVCDKTQYKEATLWEKIKLSAHLIYCRACRKYTKNNSMLTKKIKESKVECMTIEAKKAMKENLKQALKESTL